MSDRFGTNDALYDALRVVSMLGQPQISAGAPPGVLENKIYIWHANGSEVEQFTADFAGLVIAIGVVNGYDTIWLPSMEIICTAGITLPAGAALVGISKRSKLSFGGFNGTALALSEDSIVKNITLDMVSNGTTAIGIDARNTGAVVDEVIVTVSGGSADNIGVKLGA